MIHNTLKMKELWRMRTASRFLFCVLFFLSWMGCSKPPAPEVLRQAQDAEELARRTLDSLQALRMADTTKPALQPAGHFRDVISRYTSLVEDYASSPEAEVALFRR